MEEDHSLDMLILFKLESDISDVQVQLNAVNRLPRIAQSLGEEATREELIPYLKEYLNKLYNYDGIQMHLALVLAEIYPYLGGSEHVEVLFDIFDILASTNDLIVREAAVESLIKIAEQLDYNTLNGPFVDFMSMLLEKDWHAPKSSAVELFSTLYPRVSEETKNVLREQFLKLYEDDSFKKIAVMNLNNFSKVLEEQYVETVALGLLVQIASDDQDSMKTHSVDLIVEISKLLKKELIKDHIIDLIRKLADDLYWKVRQSIARNITEIQLSIGQDLSKEHLIKIIKNLSNDDESHVREALAENIVDFTIKLQNHSEGLILEDKIEKELIPTITKLYYDSSSDVSTKISENIMNLINILDHEQIKEHLLSLFNNLEKQTIDENFVYNLNRLIITIGLEDVESAVLHIMFKLLAMPGNNWRARRGLIITIKIIMARCDAEKFLKLTIMPFYYKLLSDHIFSIRRTAPLILPMMIRKFGMTWSKLHLLNNIFCFAGHKNYLYRYIVLFCIDEIIEPTLQIDKKAHLSHVDNPEKLFRIYYLKEVLDIVLYEGWIEDLIQNNEDDLSDEVSLYAEDTLYYLKQENLDVFSQPVNEHGEDYLESVLHLIVKYVLEIVKELSADKVKNVRNRSALTIKKIFRLKMSLQDDFNEVQDILNGISEDVKDICRREVHNVLCTDEEYMKSELMHKDRSKDFKKSSPSIVKKVNQDSVVQDSTKKVEIKKVEIKKLEVKKVEEVEPQDSEIEKEKDELGIVSEDSVYV